MEGDRGHSNGDGKSLATSRRVGGGKWKKDRNLEATHVFPSSSLNFPRNQELRFTEQLS